MDSSSPVIPSRNTAAASTTAAAQGLPPASPIALANCPAAPESAADTESDPKEGFPPSIHPLPQSGAPLLQQHPHPHIGPTSPLTLHAAIGSLRVGVAQRLMWMGQLAAAIQHCHRLRIAVPYLSASAVALPGARPRARVTLSPAATVLMPADGRLSASLQSRPAYAPPELLRARAYDAAKADIWILGVVFVLILAGAYPFVDSDPMLLLRKICHAAPALPEHMPAAARDLLLAMLDKAPASRPTIDGVLESCNSLLQQYIGGIVPVVPARKAAELRVVAAGAACARADAFPDMHGAAACKHPADDDGDVQPRRAQY